MLTCFCWTDESLLLTDESIACDIKHGMTVDQTHVVAIDRSFLGSVHSNLTFIIKHVSRLEIFCQ